MKKTEKIQTQCYNYQAENVVDRQDTNKGLAQEAGCFGLLRQQEIYKQLHELFEEKKIYLDSKLTLASLSKMLGTNSTYISRIINHHYGCNFRTLLKRYRIKYSQKLLQEEEECSIETLAKQCGFVSRSTFHAAFREQIHISPAEYRYLYQVKKFNNEENNR